MAKPRKIEPLERIARTLCRMDGHPEDIKFEGKPMWESYRNHAAAVLLALQEGDELAGGLIIARK